MTARPAQNEFRREFQVRELKINEGNLRLDQFLVDQFLANQSVQLTRSRLHSLIIQGHVRVNGNLARPSQRVRPGDIISVTVPPPRELDLAPERIPLEVIFQDPDLIVINKPAGLSVHPGPGHPGGTLVNALLACCPDIRGIGGALRPGIVHRLDKDTSGLMMIAKTDRAHLHLSQQIKSRLVTKGYLALAMGRMMPREGIIDAPIARDPRDRKKMAVVVGGKESRTRFRVVEQFDGGTLLELYLESGRTHQIRVHLADLGHPLLGDAVYGRASTTLGRQFLHAHHLSFQHPSTGGKLDFRTGLPEDLASVLGHHRRFGSQTQGGGERPLPG
jgi:23S rRNA pseudouridine1911/1915/1917 synthase